MSVLAELVPLSPLLTFPAACLLLLQRARRDRRREARAPYAGFDIHVARQWPVDCPVHGLQYASNLEPGCNCPAGGAA